MPAPRPSRRLAACLAGLSLLALIPAAGCYRRVVKAEGIGASGMAVQKEYRANSALDRAVFGDERSEQHKDRPPGFKPRH